MTDLSIRLARFNSNGILASIKDEEEMEYLDVYRHRHTTDAGAVCRKAADRLRVLADAFDRLATMEDPLKEVTQHAALYAAQENANG